MEEKRGQGIKAIAQNSPRVECREPMRSNTLIRSVAIAATLAFIWTLALSVSPRLHERIHANQSHADHSCAVTFLRSGSCHHAAAPILGVNPDSGEHFVGRVVLNPPWVRSPFLTAAIFEHAPPVHS
jgi:hypothetical protein